MAPRDAETLVDMLHTALAYDGGPVALRYPRGTAAGSPPERAPVTIPIGRGEILRTGERVALLGYGSGVGLALAAADRLLGWHGVQATVADARFAKPLDTELIFALMDDHDVLVTVEENVLAGGIGSAVAELLVDRDRARHTRLVRVGLPDRYVTHGAPHLLREEVGLTPDAIARRVAVAAWLDEPAAALSAPLARAREA